MENEEKEFEAARKKYAISLSKTRDPAVLTDEEKSAFVSGWLAALSYTRKTNKCPRCSVDSLETERKRLADMKV